jgi:hypothetical protein
MAGGDPWRGILRQVRRSRRSNGFLAERASEDRYLIEPIDYRSADGFYRNYRFIFVDEEILPYHLAIGDGWKLHRDSTDNGKPGLDAAQGGAIPATPNRSFPPVIMTDRK